MPVERSSPRCDALLCIYTVLELLLCVRKCSVVWKSQLGVGTQLCQLCSENSDILVLKVDFDENRDIVKPLAIRVCRCRACGGFADTMLCIY